MDAKKRKKQLFQTFLIFGTLLYLVVIYFTLHIGHMPAVNSKLSGFDLISAGIQHALSKPLMILPIVDVSYLLYGSFLFLIVIAYVYFSEKRRDVDKNASGDAEWNDNMAAYNKKYNEPFGKAKDTSGYGNTILAKDLYLSLNGSKTRRNCHSIVFGGSGSGKSYSLVKPNVLQMNASFICTDPKGELLEELAHPLEENGYEIKIFNLNEMHKSMCYNPYAYIRDDNGVRKMVKCIIDNTRGTQNTGMQDPIWEDSMTALLQAISFYMIEKCPPEERNLSNAMKMLRMAQIDENNTSAKSSFDLLFEKLEQENPKSMAVMSYKTFRIGSGNTLKSILITCMTRLDVFNMKSVTALTSRDTIHLEELGRKRQALFIIIPAEDKTFNFLAATMYTQLFETLYHQVENEYPTSYLLQKGNDTYLTSQSKDELKTKQGLIGKSKVKFNAKEERYEVWADNILLDSFSTEKSANWFIEHAKDGCKIVRGRRALPYDVRFMLDEFANVGKIPGFVEKLSTMRSYRIWCSIILQNIGQLKSMWGDDSNTIIGNCDSFIYLGSQEKDMIEYVQTMLAKTTKRQGGTSLNYGGGGNESFQYTGANLMEFNQIREMGDNECIVFLRGEKPFKKMKFDYHKHPKWELTGDCNHDFKYDNQLDNTKVQDIKKDKKQSAEDKQKIYEMQIERTGEESVISKPKDTGEIIDKVTGGRLDTLTKVMSFDDDAEDLSVAATPEDIKKSEDKFDESAEEMENEEFTGDVWDMMSEGL